MSDILAMGGRPIAVTNAIWADGLEQASKVLLGMKAASDVYDIPIVGGHTNLRTANHQLSVSILGRASSLLTSFDAQPGDVLMTAIDMRGSYRDPFPNCWQAALKAPPDRIRGDMELLPSLAEKGLCRCAKDISQGGILGTALMISEFSQVGMNIDLDSIHTPEGVDLTQWLDSFPNFGFVLAVSQKHVSEVKDHFQRRSITVNSIGSICDGSEVTLMHGTQRALFWDHKKNPYIGFSKG